MSNHSVIEHRANYYHVRVEEDYISICRKGKASPHCKALILSILEHWTNTKRDKGEKPIIYMTYPLWQESMYCLFGRNMIIMSLQELENEGLIKKHPHTTPDNKDTYAYSLNIETVQSKLKDLPEKGPDDTRPNSNAFKNKRVLKQTHLEKDGIPVLNQTPNAFKKGRNVSSTTQLQNITSKESVGSNDFTKPNTLESSDSNPSLSSLSAQNEMAEMKARIQQLESQLSSKQVPSGDTNVPNTSSPTTSTQPTTTTPSSVRDNLESSIVDSGSHAHSVEHAQDVEQKSIQDDASNRIAKGTINEKENIEAVAIRDEIAVTLFPEVDNSTQSKEKGKRRSQRTKKEISEEQKSMKSRVKSFCAAFKAIGEEMFNDPDFYVRTPSMKEDLYDVIVDLIENKASQEQMRLVFMEFWNDKGQDGKYWWRDPSHLTLNALCKNFGTRLASARFSQKQAEKKQSSATQPNTSFKLTSISGLRNYSAEPEKEPVKETQPGTMVKIPEFRFKRVTPVNKVAQIAQ